MSSNEEDNLSGFSKIQKKCETDGYAEGLSDGRDAVFQEGFDAGYKEAFSLAFQLGYQKSTLTHEKQNIPLNLQKTTAGNCLLCKDPSLMKKDLKEIVKHHEQREKI